MTALLLVAVLGLAPTAEAAGAPSKEAPRTETKTRTTGKTSGKKAAPKAPPEAPPLVVPPGVDPAQARLDTLTGAISDLDLQVIYAKNKLRVTEDYLKRLQAYAGQWTAYQQALQARIDRVARRAQRAVVALYQRGQQDDGAFYAAVIGTGSRPYEAAAATRYLSVALQSQRRTLDELGQLRAQADTVAQEATAKTAEVAEAQTKLAEDRKKLEKLRSQVATTRKRNKVEDRKERQLMAQVLARKEQYLREMALLETESSSIAKWLRGLQGKQRLALRRPRTFVLAVQGPYSSPFGMRTHPVYGDTRLHTGIDISAKTGTPIVAAGPGTVVWAGARGGYGNMVVIDHGNGLATLYAHQSKVSVAVGEVVATGDPIGEGGATGVVTGPHLHFEVRERGTPVDPYGYL